MFSWSKCRFLVLLLGAWIAISPILSAANAVTMAVQAGLSGEAGPAQGGCCPERGPEGASCQLMCLNAGQMAVICEPARLTVDVGGGHNLDRCRESWGQLRAPDLAPPKTVALL